MSNESAEDATQTPTYYDILGVRPDVPQSLVHDAYVAALKYFRENYDSDPDAQQGIDRVRLAYKVIGNAEGRAAYNATINLDAPAQRKWRPYLEEEEESLQFWTGFAATAFWFLFVGWWSFLLRSLIWLGGKIIAAVSGRSKETDDSRA